MGMRGGRDIPARFLRALRGGINMESGLLLSFHGHASTRTVRNGRADNLPDYPEARIWDLSRTKSCKKQKPPRANAHSRIHSMWFEAEAVAFPIDFRPRRTFALSSISVSIAWALLFTTRTESLYRPDETRSVEAALLMSRKI